MCAQKFIHHRYVFYFFFFFFLFYFLYFHIVHHFWGVRIDEVDVVEEEWVEKRDAYDDGHSCELVFVHFLPIIIDAYACIQKKV